MIKLDIATSQIVWYEGNQGVIRRISKDGKEIVLSLETGDVITVSPEELLYDNPDIVYEEVSE